jgi:hypothetical protein
MRDTGDKTYHERVANGNSCIVVLVKNFHFGLISTGRCRNINGFRWLTHALT